MSEKPRYGWRFWGRLGLIGLALLVLNLAVYYALPEERVTQLGDFGYGGALLVAAVANATVIIPVPYFPVIIRLAQVLEPFGVILAAALGSAIGESVAYFVGRSGRGAAEQTPMYRWVQRQLSSPWRAPLVLFGLSAPPNPAFDIAGLLSGAMGVPYPVFFIAVFLGRIIRMGTVIWIGLALS